MLRSVIACSLIAWIAAVAPGAAQTQSGPERPRLGLDLHNSFGATTAIAGRLSFGSWGVLVRSTKHERREAAILVLSQDDASDPFEELEDTGILVEGARRFRGRHAITVAAGLARWSGQVAGGPARQYCTSSWLGYSCFDRYALETYRPTWGPTGEVFYHLDAREDTWLLSRLIVGARLGPHSLLSGVYFGVGSGSVGR